MAARVQHTLVIVRHVQGLIDKFKPAVAHVRDIVSYEGCEDSHAQDVLEEVKEKFLSDFPEFEDSDVEWIVHLERRF